MAAMNNNSNVWKDILNSPTYVVAPMVDASELAWRLLSRRHGAQLCYSPMYHSGVFIKDTKYRSEALASCQQDRPLIIQFCGNDADTLCEAALLAESHCDAIDINLGCPQSIAKRGHYGAFLQDDWQLLNQIVSSLNKTLKVPVTCKIRVFADIKTTVAYAQMLESAGCAMLTVHGRTRDQKGPLTGIANWKYIKAVKDNVNIPVLANGNIQCLQDIERCIEETGCDGVMTAEGNLYNPFIFESVYPPCWDVAAEYLDIVTNYPCPLSYIRGHLFKLFHRIFSLLENKDLRNELAEGGNVEDFRKVVNGLRDRYLQCHTGEVVWSGFCDSYDLMLPPWLCQSYVRPTPKEHLQRMAEAQSKVNQKENNPTKRLKIDLSEIDERKLSKKKYKKLLKHPGGRVRRIMELCSDNCPNPKGLKCCYQLCKSCCRTKCYTLELDCLGHEIFIKSKREKARTHGKIKPDKNQVTNGIS